MYLLQCTYAHCHGYLMLAYKQYATTACIVSLLLSMLQVSGQCMDNISIQPPSTPRPASTPRLQVPTLSYCLWDTHYMVCLDQRSRKTSNKSLCFFTFRISAIILGLLHSVAPREVYHMKAFCLNSNLQDCIFINVIYKSTEYTLFTTPPPESECI